MLWLVARFSYKKPLAKWLFDRRFQAGITKVLFSFFVLANTLLSGGWHHCSNMAAGDKRRQEASTRAKGRGRERGKPLPNFYVYPSYIIYVILKE